MAWLPIGYIAKTVVASPPGWLNPARVNDIYSVSGCMSPYFADYIPYWRHNGFWLFDSPDILRSLAADQHIDLSGTTLFYYETWDRQYQNDGSDPQDFSPEPSLTTAVQSPEGRSMEGYDIVSFSAGNAPECSYLSCNRMARTLPVNRHCLFDDLEQARACLEQRIFKDCEPGPCRLIAVYRIDKA